MKDFNLYYKNQIQHFEAQIDAYFSSEPESQLKKAMLYSLCAGGKRIRPIFIYIVGELFNTPIEKLNSAAMAMECIHTYSLIHDDLPAMDNDDLRRGKPTCHIQFSEAEAILAGDALLTQAFTFIANDPLLSAEVKVNLIKELSEASGMNGMCLGQSLDLASEERKISLEELNTIHLNKTGALLTAAVRMGGILAEKSAAPYLTNLTQYAHYLGLAFQIQDDILDITGSKEKMGKNQGADIKLEKNTYPSILGLEASISHTESLYQKAIESLEPIPYDCERLKQLAQFIVHRDY